MRITRKSFLLGGLAATLARPALAKTWTTVRVATEGAFPPFNSTAPDGSIVGFEPDVIAEIGRRQKVNFTLMAQAWDGVIPGLTDGKFDMIASGMSITPKREEVIAFSRPYTDSPTGLTVLKDGPITGLPGTGERISLEDDAATQRAVAELGAKIAGKTIAVQVATIQLDFLNRYLKDKVEIRTYASGPDTYLDLKNGRVDAVISSASNASSFIKRSRGDMLRSGYGFVGGVLGRGAAFGLRKDDPELKQLLDAGLTSMIEDGSLRALSTKWFELDITPKA